MFVFGVDPSWHESDASEVTIAEQIFTIVV